MMERAKDANAKVAAVATGFLKPVITAISKRDKSSSCINIAFQALVAACGTSNGKISLHGREALAEFVNTIENSVVLALISQHIIHGPVRGDSKQIFLECLYDRFVTTVRERERRGGQGRGGKPKHQRNQRVYEKICWLCNRISMKPIPRCCPSMLFQSLCICYRAELTVSSPRIPKFLFGWPAF